MLKVFYADTAKLPLPDYGRIYSVERREYLQSITDAKNAAQSYHVWLLLQCALDRESGDAEKYNFSVTENGRWVCTNAPLFFSLSHSENAVVAALSSCGAVGADVEVIGDRILKLEKRLLNSAKEEKIFRGLTGDERKVYLTSLWCDKESKYKFGNNYVWHNKPKFHHKIIEFSENKQYFVSVCSEAEIDVFEKLLPE